MFIVFPIIKMDIRKYFKPLPSDKTKIYKLDDECWIEQCCLPCTLKETYNFDELWRIHPEEYGQVSYMGKVVRTPRWQQTYLKDYFFSGCLHRALPLPQQLKPFFEWANTIVPNTMRFNQVLVNWYANGKHYIGPHSDDERELVNYSPVLSVSLGQERIFRIRDKATKEIVVDIPMQSDTYVMMCGNIQKKYLHEVPKVSGKKGDEMDRRINITFRVFK